jgi:putative transposase
MKLTHKVALRPTPEQLRARLRRGAARLRSMSGTSNAQQATGQTPKKQFNAIKHTDPQWLTCWLKDVHRDAHAQPFRNLAKAWERFFADLKEGKEAHKPQLKKCRDSFYVANDKFTLNGKTIRLPKVGEVAMTEELRFAGKILGATVSSTADRWFYRSRPLMRNSIGVARRTRSTASTWASKLPQRSPTVKSLKRPNRSKQRCAAWKSVVSWKPPRRQQDLPACSKGRACRSRTTGESPLRNWDARIANIRADLSPRLASAAKTKR